ncbi:unnamed protein product [Caenorhabditis bovis]|uniref:Uncharacterized protein n=1 Tax=Caenorhabditis bovis TaxID=2654633 RepID=A0A8S1EYB1_9PELO|nr:unnamed protein product [Caenorhabditis bovis]
MPPNQRKSLLTNEERINRLKEARLKYGNLSKARTSKSQQSALIGTSKPRQGISTRTSQSKEHPKTKSQASTVVDFEPCPESLKMIDSGKVVIPRSTFGRPSLNERKSIAPRPSISGRNPRQFRNSVANEPRSSLLPLGINVFHANEQQKNELSQYFSSQASRSSLAPNSDTSNCPTPSRASSSSVFGRIGLKSANTSVIEQRSQTIRFMETNVIQEQRESAESCEIETESESARKHSPCRDPNFVPKSILSTKKKPKKSIIGNLKTIASPITLGTFDSNSMNEENCENKKNVSKIIEDMTSLIDALKTCKEDPTVSDVVKLKVLKEDIEKIISRKTIRESLNESIVDVNEPLRFLQGAETLMKTPKAFKEFRESIPPIAPLSDIVESILNSQSPEEDKTPLPKRRRSVRKSSELKIRGGLVVREPVDAVSDHF